MTPGDGILRLIVRPWAAARSPGRPLGEVAKAERALPRRSRIGLRGGPVKPASDRTPGGSEEDRRPRERFNETVTGPVQVRSERDVLRETFDTFAEGLCVVGSGGALEVSNAPGGRLWATPLRSELISAARETVESRVTASPTFSFPTTS